MQICGTELEPRRCGASHFLLARSHENLDFCATSGMTFRSHGLDPRTDSDLKVKIAKSIVQSTGHDLGKLDHAQGSGSLAFRLHGIRASWDISSLNGAASCKF